VLLHGRRDYQRIMREHDLKRDVKGAWGEVGDTADRMWNR
jgi:hypothetical protein